MARTPEGADWREVLPGMLILGVLICASTLTFLIGQIRRQFAEGPRVIVLAAESKGLQPGAAVWVAGKPSGRVIGIQFGDPTAPESTRVVIEAVLRRDAMPEIRADAKVGIGSSALLAPAVLKLVPGTAAAAALASGDTLRVGTTQDFERFRMLADSMRAAIDTLSVDAERLRARLVDGSGSAARFLDDPGVFARLDSMRVRSTRLMAALRGGGGAGRLARDDSTLAALRRVAGNLEEIERLRLAAGVPDSVAAILEASARVGRRAARIAAGLEAARGTAGRALHDPALAEQTEAAREALRALGPALVADPWRWLRIKPF